MQSLGGLVGQLLLATHIVASAGLFVGVVGRNVSLARAGRSAAMPDVTRLVHVAGRFERLLVIPGSMIVLATGVALAWLRGWPLLGFLQGAHVNWLLAALVLAFSVALLIVYVFIPRGKIFEAALAGAKAQGHVTSELRAAFRDRAVRRARAAEYVITAAVVYLMVAKPF